MGREGIVRVNGFDVILWYAHEFCFSFRALCYGFSFSLSCLFFPLLEVMDDFVSLLRMYSVLL